MFQTFDSASDSAQAASRVSALREQLEALDLTGFLVPRADEHQGEYVAPCSERLSWLTGFTGSAGAALILRDSAILFVDGRYTLQAAEQTDSNIFQIESLVTNPPRSWMKASLPSDARIGFDPWLHTIGEMRSMREALVRRGVELVPVGNLVDKIWQDRPAPPVKPVTIHPLQYAGETAGDKLDRIGEVLREANIAHTVLTDPSSLAWLFNIRGSDVPHTPLALGFAILSAHGRPKLFLHPGKLSIETKAYLTQLADLHLPEMLESELTALASSEASIGLDPALAAEKLRAIVEAAGRNVEDFKDPTRLPRAIKNAVELAGSRNAHHRDGAAVASFLAWLDRQTPEELDEIAVVEKLEAFRRETGERFQMPLKDISFDTISGSGPNGAIIHYRVNRQSSRRLSSHELLLLDSGAQYEDGTTDITRTIALGQAYDEQRQRFTLVLKGMIAITRLRFPEGTRGVDIDAFARTALWQHGLDYAHGTGHGVGSYLAVHEGPQSISRRGMEKLHAGMILSNEPGYYKPGHYGIRIENLIAVTPAEEIAGGDIPMHGFETLTLAPIDRKLIAPELLSAEERAWLDEYHARVMQEIAPLVDEETRTWLEAATAPL